MLMAYQQPSESFCYEAALRTPGCKQTTQLSAAFHKLALLLVMLVTLLSRGGDPPSRETMVFSALLNNPGRLLGPAGGDAPRMVCCCCWHLQWLMPKHAGMSSSPQNARNVKPVGFLDCGCRALCCMLLVLALPGKAGRFGACLDHFAGNELLYCIHYDDVWQLGAPNHASYCA